MSATSWVSPVCTPVALSRAYKQSTTPLLSCISSNIFPRKSEAPTTNLRRSVEHGGLRLNARSSSTAKRLNVVRARNIDDNMDDKGVVKDMEQYLNDLAIEYDNVWDTKPAWCQPWTIVLTGMTGVTVSYFLFHSQILTAVVGALVAAWWFLFLYSYPMAYTEMIAQRRKDQRAGIEDTFGTRQRND